MGFKREVFFVGIILVTLITFGCALIVPDVSKIPTVTYDQWALVSQKGVFVSVKNIDPKIVPLGLTKDQVKTDVELQLRKAGVRVLTEKESRGMPGHPYLSVDITISEIKISNNPVGYAYYVGVQLSESVRVARGYEVIGSIWSIGSVGAIGKDASPIRSIISGSVDKFINDYLAANPKR